MLTFVSDVHTQCTFGAGLFPPPISALLVHELNDEVMLQSSKSALIIL